jgi:hypothetical protein
MSKKLEDLDNLITKQHSGETLNLPANCCQYKEAFQINLCKALKYASNWHIETICAWLKSQVLHILYKAI